MPDKDAKKHAHRAGKKHSHQNESSTNGKDEDVVELNGTAEEPEVAATADAKKGPVSKNKEDKTAADAGDPESLRTQISELQAKLAEAQKSAVQVAEDKTPGDFWWKCGKCRKGVKAKVFCVDCPKGKQYFCHKCCALEHDWDLKTRFHSMEAIKPKQSTSIVFALVDALLLPVLVFCALRRAGIPEGYNDGVDVCPLVDQARRAVFNFDAGISLYTKHHFSMPCNLEDGYIRLWLDTFVRGIATDTDSFFLLLATAFRARLYHYFIIRTVLAPFFVILQAVISTAVYFLTSGLPDLENNNMLKPFRRLLTKLVDYIQKPSSRLPNTMTRSRPMMQFKDCFTYWCKSRIPRQFQWAKNTAYNRLAAFSAVLFCIPIAIRVCSLFLRMGPIFHTLAETLLPNSFWHSPNIDFAQVTKDKYTSVMLESIFTGSVQTVVNQVPNVTQYTVTYTPGIVLWVVATLEAPVKTLFQTLSQMLWDYYIFVGGILLVYGIISYVKFQIKWIYDYQQKQFDKAANDMVKAPLTNYRCQVKWMPLLD